MSENSQKLPFIVNEGYSKEEIKKQFKNNSFMGGINICKKMNSIVIIANHTKSLYDDEWDQGIFRYTGAGRIGNQKMTNNNKALKNAKILRVNVFLFEVFNEKKKNRFVYKGQLHQVGKERVDLQPDANGMPRKVFRFEFKPSNHKAAEYSLNDEDNMQYLLARQRIILKRPDEELFKAIVIKEKSKSKKRNYTFRKTKFYKRDPDLAAAVKRIAKGNCMLCKDKAPFVHLGKPFLESHHIRPLSEGGNDNINNLVAVCPNCHRKVHHVRKKKHMKELKQINDEKVMSIMEEHIKQYEAEKDSLFK